MEKSNKLLSFLLKTKREKKTALLLGMEQQPKLWLGGSPHCEAFSRGSANSLPCNSQPTPLLHCGRALEKPEEQSSEEKCKLPLALQRDKERERLSEFSLYHYLLTAEETQSHEANIEPALAWMADYSLPKPSVPLLFTVANPVSFKWSW